MAEKDRLHTPLIIGQEEARHMMDAGSALFVDVRRTEQYDRVRIPGALSIPIRGSAEEFFHLPQDRDIIFY